MSIELVARAKKTKLHGDSTAKLLLIVLADYANDDGMAWPSVATMAQEVEKSERSIQLLLRKLEAKGLIRKGDQKLVGKYAKGRRPVVYKLFPKKTKTEKPEEPHDDTENRGEASFTPETGFTGETDCAPRVKPASPHGRNPLHPTGETHFALGVKPISPKPSKEPSIEPSRESTRAKNQNRKPKPPIHARRSPTSNPTNPTGSSPKRSASTSTTSSPNSKTRPQPTANTPPTQPQHSATGCAEARNSTSAPAAKAHRRSPAGTDSDRRAPRTGTPGAASTCCACYAAHVTRPTRSGPTTRAAGSPNCSTTANPTPRPYGNWA